MLDKPYHERTVAEDMLLGKQWGGSVSSVLAGRGATLGTAMGLGSGIRSSAAGIAAREYGTKYDNMVCPMFGPALGVFPLAVAARGHGTSVRTPDIRSMISGLIL